MFDVATAQFLMGLVNLLLTTLVAVLTSASFRSRCRDGRRAIDVAIRPRNMPASPSSASSGSAATPDAPPPSPEDAGAPQPSSEPDEACALIRHPSGSNAVING
jgi:hypothetical protein